MGRYISLVIITALGAASVVGIQAASIDMRDTADKLYKESGLYDLQLKSAMGFDDGDIAALRGTAGVAEVMPTYTYDVFIYLEGEVLAARTYALPDSLNAIRVLEGRLPENAAECAVESSVLRAGGYTLGDSVTLGLDDMGDYYDMLAGDTFTIVGTVSSPLYISGHERGNTTLGDGSLNFYLYLHPDAYVVDVYTDAYILMDGSREMDNLTEAYYAAADGWKRQIKLTGDTRIKDRQDELADAQADIDDGWAEYYDGVRELEEKTAEGRRELEDAKIKLDDAREALADGKKTLDAKIAAGKRELAAKEAELRDGETELDVRYSELENGQAELDAARGLLEERLAELESKGPQGISPELDGYYEQVDESLRLLAAKQAELDYARTALDSARAELEDGAGQISAARETLEKERVRAQAEINDGWAEYYKGLGEYDDGVQTLDKEEADAAAKLNDARLELEDAQEKLDSAPEPEWFYFTRKDGVAFDSYYQDTLRLQKIGYVFPMVFFLVAVMVSLTSMSRMVEEHRTQIGVYKALGYRPAAIMAKYFIYAFSASLAGGALGILVGSWLFPVVISDAYGYLYSMPPVETPVPFFIGMLALVIGVVSVVLVTLTACAGSMKGSPALLMRPKPPSAGKRIFLERIGFVWSRFSFIGKVTARNIFRYKKRFFMTLFGILGCSALLLTAFGLRDSIQGVSELQYGSIVKYDARAYLKDITTERQRAGLGAALPDDYLFIREEAVDAAGDEGGLSASLIVPEVREDLIRFINLYSPETGESVPLPPDGVLVTEKLARVMGVSVGDSFDMTAGNGGTHTVRVAGIVENYVMHYIYMSGEVYSELNGGRAYPNSVLAFTGNEREFAREMLENKNVRAVIGTAELLSRLSKSTDAIGIVTIVLIALACMLALVVLFNLTNINISERIRELATIKVLGFYNTELAMYVYRENGAVTFMGIALGLVGGIFLHRFVLASVEIDLLKFPLIINFPSYIYAVALSLAFAVFVNLVMNYKLARIDMVESLKNVE
jgi:putative ABC transport system permease protein